MPVGTVRVGAQTMTVDSATLELFNLFSKRPDWVLDARLESSAAVPRIWIAGTGEPAPYTRDRKIDAMYLDAPVHLALDGLDGVLSLATQGQLVAAELSGGRARIEGTLRLHWKATRSHGETPDRELELIVDLVAALVT